MTRSNFGDAGGATVAADNSEGPALMQDFVAYLSHEVRGSLHATMGLLRLLECSPLAETQRERVRQMLAICEHTVSIANDALDFLKAKEGRLVLHPSVFSFDDLFDRLEAMAMPMASRKALRFHIDATGLPPIAIGDCTRLTQAIFNYVSNALKVTRDGYVVLHCHATGEDSDSLRIRVEVEDTGPGIDPDRLARIFDRFQSGPEANSQELKGSGLGLVITRQIAEAMGGETGVRSVPGVGSTFWLTATLAKATVKQSREGLLRRQPTSRVLAIDPAPGSVGALKQLRRDTAEAMAGIHCTLALSPGVPEALEAICRADSKGRPFSAVLIWDRGPDSLGLIAEIGLLHLEKVPERVLITTDSRYDLNLLDRVERLGCRNVLLEPIDSSRLAEAIVRIVEARREEAGRRHERRPSKRTSGCTRDIGRSKARLLLADDDPVSLAISKETLEKHLECNVTAVANGLEACAMLENAAFDLVLLDMNMPIMGGVDVTRRLRESPGNAATPVVMVTANALEEDREACRAAGANEVLSKPFDDRTLCEAVQRHVGSPVAAKRGRG